MVSVHPSPPPGQGFTRLCTGGDPMEMKRAESNTASFWKSGPGLEDPSKKVRKPYTITKSRENWSELEHEMFLEALHLFDRDWKKIEAFIGSKSVIQIRSHAQKYFLKVQKNGSERNEHVPPPRPKRKSAHPYPQKAPKKVHRNTNEGAILSPWTYNGVSTGCPSRISKVTPDFAQVYRFIGSVFDHNASDHLQRLKMMDPVNVETVLMLMRNLSANLASPEFENHVVIDGLCVGGISRSPKEHSYVFSGDELGFCLAYSPDKLPNAI